MKLITCLLIVLFAIANNLNAQSVSSESNKIGSVGTTYDRNAITVMVLDSKNKYAADLKNGSSEINVPGKYDNNMLDARNLSASSNSTRIQNALINNKIPNDIVAKWFARDSETGKLNMSVVHERGLYNATDDDVMRASGSKIGLAKLKDAGELLLKHSYILVIELKDIESMEEKYDRQDKKLKALAEQLDKDFEPVKRRKNGWVGDAKTYLYRLDFNDSIMNYIYNDLWIYDDDDEKTASKKKALFSQVNLPITFVLSTEGNADGSQYNKGEILAPPTQLNRQQLFGKLINTGLTTTLYEIERKVEEFRVKTPLYGTHPLKAKIGKKEGVKTEQRYFVYEFEQNRNGKTKANRKGVVRAKTVIDNRNVATGNSQLYTTFYQTAGFKLMDGMMLQQRNDMGVGVTLNYGVNGELSGMAAKVELNLTVLGAKFMNADFGVNQVKLYASAAADAGTYNLAESNLNLETSNYDMSFVRFAIGLSKGWYVANNFSVNPFIGYALETASNDDLIEQHFDDDEQEIGTDFMHWGAYATVNVLHNIQIVGTLNMYNVIGTAYDKDRKEINGNKYNDIFKGRSGASIDLGVRFEF